MTRLAHVAIDLAARVEALLLLRRQWCDGRGDARLAGPLDAREHGGSTCAQIASGCGESQQRRRLTIEAQYPRAAPPGGTCADVDRRSLGEGIRAARAGASSRTRGARQVRRSSAAARRSGARSGYA